MHEYIGNLHAHTVYSDGEATHDEVAAAAVDAGLDVVWVTDHNVYAHGLDGYRYRRGRRVLLLVGEEIHDQIRVPQKNHMLVLEARRELCGWIARVLGEKHIASRARKGAGARAA